MWSLFAFAYSHLAHIQCSCRLFVLKTYVTCAVPRGSQIKWWKHERTSHPSSVLYIIYACICTLVSGSTQMLCCGWYILFIKLLWAFLPCRVCLFHVAVGHIAEACLSVSHRSWPCRRGAEHSGVFLPLSLISHMKICFPSYLGMGTNQLTN